MHLRLVRPTVVALLAAFATVACDHSPTAPDPAKAATQAADRFDKLADSLTTAGDDGNATFAQAMADLIRVVGRVDNVVVKVDGRSVTHTTLAIETLVPQSACDNTTDPALCRENNPAFSQIILGWTGTDLREGFIAYSEQAGVASAVDDGSGTMLVPAFVVYSLRDVAGIDFDLFGAPSRTWYSDGGTVTTQPGARGAACDLPPVFQFGVTVACHKASFSPAFDVSATEFTYGDSPTIRHLTMAPQRVDGVSVDVIDAFDDAPSPPAARHRASPASVRALLQRVVPVFLRRAPATR